MKEGTVAALVKWLISAAIGLWISVPAAVRILAIICCFDVLTGLLSHKCNLRELLRRICVSLILVLAIHYVYSMAKQEAGLNVGFDIASMVGVWYIFAELISIAHNCVDAGGDVPPLVLDWLDKAQGLTSREHDEIQALRLKQSQEMTALDVKQSQERSRREP